MKNYSFHLLFPFLLFPSLTNAQDSAPSITRQKGKYQYQDKSYNKKEIGLVLKEDKLAWKHYKDYKKSKNGGIIFGSASVTLFGLSLIPLSKHARTWISGPPDEKNGARFLTLFLSGVVTGTIMTGLSIGANGDFNKSIQVYNENTENRKSIGANPMHLNLQYSENGVGLVLNF